MIGGMDLVFSLDNALLGRMVLDNLQPGDIWSWWRGDADEHIARQQHVCPSKLGVEQLHLPEADMGIPVACDSVLRHVLGVQLRAEKGAWGGVLN